MTREPGKSAPSSSPASGASTPNTASPSLGSASLGGSSSAAPAVTLDAEDYEALMAVLATYERLADIDPETTRRMRLMERMHSLREGVFNRIFPVFVIGYCINLGLFSLLILVDRLILPLVALWQGSGYQPILESQIILSVIAATVAQSAAFVLGMGRWLFPAKPL
jgi:hypothetical protein